MESKYNFNSQICTTREQSVCLLALGLKKDTADCYYWRSKEPMYGEASGKWYLETLDSKDSQEYFEYLDKNFGVCLADDEEHYFIPSWSLHRLIEMALRFVRICGISFNFNEDAYEKVIGIIEYQIEAGYFNKEYLEE